MRTVDNKCWDTSLGSFEDMVGGGCCGKGSNSSKIHHRTSNEVMYESVKGGKFFYDNGNFGITRYSKWISSSSP